MLTAAPTATRQILQTQDLTVSFDGFKALDRLNFSLEEGELRVVIGPNGAGKTTFLDVLTGKVKPTRGRVLFKGKDLTKLKEHEISILGVGRKFQTPRVYQNLSVRENLELSLNPDKRVFSTLLGKKHLREKRMLFWKPLASAVRIGFRQGCFPTEKSNGWRSAW